MMSDFLCGVGYVISGVFCISVGAPVSGAVGIGVGTSLVLISQSH